MGLALQFLRQFVLELRDGGFDTVKYGEIHGALVVVPI